METFQKIKALYKPKGLRQLENIFTTDRKKMLLKAAYNFPFKNNTVGKISFSSCLPSPL